MSQKLNISSIINNTTRKPSVNHGSVSKQLIIGDLEDGALIDVTDVAEVQIIIPASFVSNGPFVLIDETQGVIPAGEFVRWGKTTLDYIGKLTVGIPAFIELDSSVTDIFLIRNVAGTNKVRYHLFDGG